MCAWDWKYDVGFEIYVGVSFHFCVSLWWYYYCWHKFISKSFLFTDIFIRVYAFQSFLLSITYLAVYSLQYEYAIFEKIK